MSESILVDLHHIGASEIIRVIVVVAAVASPALLLAPVRSFLLGIKLSAAMLGHARLEVRVVLEVQVQGEHDVQGLDGVVVDGDV